MKVTTPLLCHVDAFTQTPFRGNPAGVVLGADGMTDVQMQALARELKHSETAFVMAPGGADHDVHIRFFTPAVEVPTCGHATIAAHYARAHVLGLGATQVRQRTGAGVQTIDVEPHEGDYRIVMQQGAPQFGDPFDFALRSEVAAALGLNIDQLAPALPLCVVSTGHSKVLIPLTAGAPLDALRPDMARLSRLSARIGCNGYFPFQLRHGQAATDGRMFAPAIGIDEDPVTGNANGPLGAYLVRHGLMPHDGAELVFDGHQGRAIGRDGTVSVRVGIADGEPRTVSVGGRAVMLFMAPLQHMASERLAVSRATFR